MLFQFTIKKGIEGVNGIETPIDKRIKLFNRMNYENRNRMKTNQIFTKSFNAKTSEETR